MGLFVCSLSYATKILIFNLFASLELEMVLTLLFLHDVWRGEMPMSSSFPRVYALDLHRHVSVSDRLSMGLGVNTLRRGPRVETE